MEISSQQHMMSALEEAMMGPKMDTTPYPSNEVYFPNTTWASLEQTPADLITNASLLGFPNSPPPFGDLHPFLDILTSPDYASYCEYDLPALHNPLVDRVNVLDDEGSYKVETSEIGGGAVCPNVDMFWNMDLYGDKRSKVMKKPDGQPSKNLMAERRRRKRLNDRLSMLRSIVPKISKMDRTSILGDTIDYTRELLDKIHKLREEGIDDETIPSSSSSSSSSSNDCRKEMIKPNEMLVRNPPKFDVARRNKETRVEVCCTGKAGLLLSTLTTVDALGLDVQHCVISCFNDFSLQASCIDHVDLQEEEEGKGVVGGSVLTRVEDIKQALLRNAGYGHGIGGRCCA